MVLMQILAICGMLSPIVYTAMWIICGKLDSNYNHIRKDISSLFAVGAPTRRLSKILMIISSVLLFVFFLGVHEGLNDDGPIIGPILLVISSFIGILIPLFFPLDEGGEITTIRGKMHIISVALMGIIQIIGMIALWFRLQRVAAWSAFGTYSLITAIVALILIIISSIFAQGNYRGLLERIGVTPYHIYYFVFGLLIFLNN
ncbi:MAG: DUF998 domain-containing protein [Candidatus Heimdallarchaeota archaeon]